MEKLLLRSALQVNHNLPKNLQPEDENDFLPSRSYVAAEVILYEINNAGISSDSVIYKNGQLVTETVAAASQISYYRIKHLLKQIITSKKQRLDDTKKYLLVTDNNSAGHFHWFCEVLPKLICIKDRTKDFILLLPDKPYIHNIALDTLRMMKLYFEDIVFIKPGIFYKAKNVYYLSNVSAKGLNDELMKEIREQFRIQTKGNRKIYISREKAGFRKIVNETALCALLRSYDFEILSGEDFSFSEQAALFSSCDTLLGIHGAGLTNSIFMKPGGKMIEVRKRENATSNVAYWHLADSLGLDYYYFNGSPDSDKPLVGRGCNLSVPLEEFENLILRNL